MNMRDWAQLTDDEKREAVLRIWGWELTAKDEDGSEHWEKGDDAVHLYDSPGYPMTSPGAAMELFKAKAKEYNLILWHQTAEESEDGLESFVCGYSVPNTTNIGGKWIAQDAQADTPEAAICQAVYQAAKARQEGA